MKPGQSAVIENIKTPDHLNGSLPADIADRLMEIGFEIGERVDVLHESPIGRDPMSVKICGRIIALRRREAAAIFLERPTRESTLDTPIDNKMETLSE
jgi:ferrous iron transport protein A